MRMASIAASLAQEAGAGRECRDVEGSSLSQLVATGLHPGWSWDFTTLKGAVQESSDDLLVILASYRRDLVGWMVAHRGRAALAHKLIQLTCDQQDIRPRPCKQLSRHILRDSQASNQHRSHGPRPYGSIGLRKSR
jgi:hypothetical protein